LGTRIDDSTNKVTLVGTDKVPLGDGSFSPKHYTVNQIAEYAVSTGGIFAVVTVSTGRDLALTDLGKYLRSEATSAVSMRVPTCASVAFPIGSTIYFRMGNTGKFSVSGAVGVSIQVPSSCSAEGRGQGSTFSIVKYTADTWDLTGDISVK
jgi:hypothetical protein